MNGRVLINIKILISYYSSFELGGGRVQPHMPFCIVSSAALHFGPYEETHDASLARLTLLGIAQTGSSAFKDGFNVKIPITKKNENNFIINSLLIVCLSLRCIF